MHRTARRGPGRPPAAKSAETRGRILRTAREVFAEVGYDAATFQEIAVRADLTRPAINHYFPSKRVLYRQVVGDAVALVIDVGAQAATQETTFTGRLQAFLRAARTAHEDEQSLAGFLMTSVLDSQRHPELGGDDHDALAAIRRFVRWALDDRTAEPTDDEVEALVAMLLGLGFYAGFVGPADRLAGITETFLAVVGGRGIGPDRPDG